MYRVRPGRISRQIRWPRKSRCIVLIRVSSSAVGLVPGLSDGPSNDNGLGVRGGRRWGRIAESDSNYVNYGSHELANLP